MKLLKICFICLSSYHSTNNFSNTCSLNCLTIYMSLSLPKRNGTKTIIKCKDCDKKIIKEFNQKGYCPQCFKKHHRQLFKVKTLKCRVCNEPFETKNSLRKLCLKHQYFKEKVLVKK